MRERNCGVSSIADQVKSREVVVSRQFMGLHEVLPLFFMQLSQFVPVNRPVSDDVYNAQATERVVIVNTVRGKQAGLLERQTKECVS